MEILLLRSRETVPKDGGGILKRLIAGLMFIMLFSLFACEMNTDTRQLLKQSDTLYLVVKTIVTDPGVMPLLSRDTLEKLLILENSYLEAKKLYLSGVDQRNIRTKLLSYAGKLIGIFEILPQMDKYKDQISAARVAVKIIKIQLE